jgi:hypothetical protein
MWEKNFWNKSTHSCRCICVAIRGFGNDTQQKQNAFFEHSPTPPEDFLKVLIHLGWNKKSDVNNTPQGKGKQQ